MTQLLLSFKPLRKMKKSFQVLTTFDSTKRWDHHTIEPATDPLRFFTCKNDGVYLLPNVPVRARDTFLAQCLRNRIPTSSFYICTFCNAEHSGYSGSKECANCGCRSKPVVIPSISGKIRRWRIERKAREVAEEINIFKRDELRGKLLGVEIEYYPRYTYPEESKLMKVKEDGSLSDGGKELVRVTWANREGRLAGLLKLRLEGRVDKSCGLHVHVDVRHLPQFNATSERFSIRETYDRLCKFYKFLKKLVPKSRLQNRYCRWRNNRLSGGRYCAINWCAYEEHGTLEFRCQGGSINLVKIETWALLCQFLVDFASKTGQTIPKNWDAFLNILPEPFRSWCILRREQLYGKPIVFDDRTKSAVE